MSWLVHPRWIAATYWASFVILSLTLYPRSFLDGHSILLIGGYVTVFTGGVVSATLHSPKTGARRVNTTPSGERHLRPMPIVGIVLLGSAGNVLAILSALRSNHLSVLEVLTLQGLLQSANAISVDRYSGSPQGGSALPALLLGLGYTAAIVAPFVKATSARFKKLLISLPVGSALLYSSVSTARLGFLTAATLTTGSIIACTVYQTGRIPMIGFKAFVTWTLAFALAGGAFVGIGLLRTGSTDRATMAVVLNKQVSYTLGGGGAFANWYDAGGSSGPLGLGTASIAGVEYLTGQNRAATRSYNEFVTIDSDGNQSNIFTAFRGLIMDFGLVGGVGVMAALGFAFGRAYRAASRGSIRAAAVLAFAYGTLLLSAWLATTTFTNVLAAAFLAPLILTIAARKAKLAAQTPRVMVEHVGT